jgi:hypothetical protein
MAPAPSNPTYKYWPLSERARTLGLLPIGIEVPTVLATGLIGVIVFALAGELLGTDAKIRAVPGSQAKSDAGALMKEYPERVIAALTDTGLSAGGMSSTILRMKANRSEKGTFNVSAVSTSYYHFRAL